MSIELEPETILHPQPTSTSNLTQPPVLSTPDTHIFEDPTPSLALSDKPVYTDDQLRDVYEIERTAREVLEGGWRRVALQFPDSMLVDAVRVFEELGREIERLSQSIPVKIQDEAPGEALETDIANLTVKGGKNEANGVQEESKVRLYILADTSYNACCVDEIAAEHVDADVVVHYGRSCLSPTKTLPVIYVFTSHSLDLDHVIEAFEGLYLGSSARESEDGKDKIEQKIVIMADITYHNHVTPLAERLRERGWKNLVTPEIQHDPDALIPNRKLPNDITSDELRSYKLFHVSTPPNALVMILYSRLDSFTVYPTTESSSTSKPEILTTTKSLLNRRYALLSHISTQPILGILINTLSHSSTTSTLSSLMQLLRKNGKKYYTFVVGKVNAAKMANFAEIGGWIVVGCWEGGLFDERSGESGGGGFWKGTITPFEVELGLKNEGWRVRGGEWRGGLSLEGTQDDSNLSETENVTEKEQATRDEQIRIEKEDESDDEEESEPPEYDFRTGRYITSSHAKTSSKSVKQSLSSTSSSTASNQPTASTSLARRAKNTEIASINGVLSPGAEFLRSQRTWQGLGSDFENAEDGDGEGGTIEEGRRGVARGYVVGDERQERR